MPGAGGRRGGGHDESAPDPQSLSGVREFPLDSVGGVNGQVLGIVQAVLPLVVPRHAVADHRGEQGVRGVGGGVHRSFQGAEREVGLSQTDRQVAGQLQGFAQCRLPGCPFVRVSHRSDESGVRDDARQDLHEAPELSVVVQRPAAGDLPAQQGGRQPLDAVRLREGGEQRGHDGAAEGDQLRWVRVTAGGGTGRIAEQGRQFDAESPGQVVQGGQTGAVLPLLLKLLDDIDGDSGALRQPFLRKVCESTETPQPLSQVLSHTPQATPPGERRSETSLNHPRPYPPAPRVT